MHHIPWVSHRTNISSNLLLYLSLNIATLEDLDLPTSDDRGTVPDSFDCPPDQSLVGEDLKAATASRHKSPSGK